MRHDESNIMLTARQPAGLLNVYINTLCWWDEKGLLKAYRIGLRGDRRYSREDVSLKEKCGAVQKL